jgi:tetratricopeptide (TPR) repeat protein
LPKIWKKIVLAENLWYPKKLAVQLFPQNPPGLNREERSPIIYQKRILAMRFLKEVSRYHFRERWYSFLYSIIILYLLFGCSPYSSEFRAGARYMQQGDNDAAIIQYSRAIEKNDKDSDIYYSRGVAYMNKQQFDKAIPDFDRVIELNKPYISSTTPKKSGDSTSSDDFLQIYNMDRAAKIGVGSRAGYAGTPGFFGSDEGGQSAANHRKKGHAKFMTWAALQLRASNSKARAESLEKAGRTPEALGAYTEYISFYKRLEPNQQAEKVVNDVYRLSVEKVEKLKPKGP